MRARTVSSAEIAAHPRRSLLARDYIPTERPARRRYPKLYVIVTRQLGLVCFDLPGGVLSVFDNRDNAREHLRRLVADWRRSHPGPRLAPWVVATYQRTT